VAQTAPLVLAPRDSALFAMNRDVVPAPSPRHARPRVRTSSCETFISLIATSGRPAGHRRAWARRGGARQPDLRYYRCCPRSASTSSGLSNEPNNSTFCPEIGSGQPFSVAAGLCARGIASALRWALRAASARESSRGDSGVDPIESLPLLGQIHCPAWLEDRRICEPSASRLSEPVGTANRRAPRPLET
jgi:hypothetical protein